MVIILPNIGPWFHSIRSHDNILRQYDILVFTLNDNNINLKSLNSRTSKLIMNKFVRYKDSRDERQSTQEHLWQKLVQEFQWHDRTFPKFPKIVGWLWSQTSEIPYRTEQIQINEQCIWPFYPRFNPRTFQWMYCDSMSSIVSNFETTLCYSKKMHVK